MRCCSSLQVVTNLQTGLDQWTGLMDQKITKNLPHSYVCMIILKHKYTYHCQSIAMSDPILSWHLLIRASVITCCLEDRLWQCETRIFFSNAGFSSCAESLYTIIWEYAQFFMTWHQPTHRVPVNDKAPYTLLQMPEHESSNESYHVYYMYNKCFITLNYTN